MKKYLLVFIFVFTGKSFFSQEWMLQTATEKNFYKIQSSFNEYWKDKDEKQRKNNGYKQFKRWEAIMEPRVFPSGNITLPTNTWALYEEYLKSTIGTAGKSQMSTSWTSMGPFGAMTGVDNTGGPRKAGRYNFVTFHPNVAGAFWCGSPSGGLWKTTNNGVSWTTNTDNLGVIGCTDLAIDPVNPNNMYLATGDGYFSGYTKSIGVLTSTNAGVTWTTSGLNFAVSAGVVMRRIIIDPSNPLKLIAATSNGIYVSNNAAATWSLAGGVTTWDVEFSPVSSNTIYAGGGGSFSVSINGGASFTQIVAGIPTPANSRLSIAVTTINPTHVYVFASQSNGIFNGVYRSTNSGTSFSLMANAPCLTDDGCTTQTVSGQGFYNLTIAASPITSGEIVVGACNVWKSLNGGATWTVIGCRDGYIPGNPPYIHADQHDLEYLPNGTLYSATDGGIFQYTGSLWNDITGNATIAQIRDIGLSSLSPNLWVTGHQDNGTNVYNNGVYDAGMHSDGEDCFIDRTDDQMIYGSYQVGGLQQSIDGGATWNSCVAGAPGPGATPSPWKQDPQVATNFWCGKDRVYKSAQPFGVIIWQACTGAMTGTVAGQFITEFDVAPSNNQMVYAIHGTAGVYRTVTAGSSWTISNTGLPAGLTKTDIIVHPTIPTTAWVTCSGYNAAQKVYKTTTGAATWTAMTTVGLPNLPVNCVVYEPGNPNDRIYIGMDIGVYYIDNITATWTPYNSGLPNVIVQDLEISPAAPNKLRAATWGRGVYQVDIVPNSAPPVTAFNYVGNKCVLTSTLYMNDNSSNSPNAWSWSVTPSAGVLINSAAAQNPTITFANSGTYSISLLSSNGFGPGSLISQTVSIFSPTINTSATSTLICLGQVVTLSALGASNYTWQPYNITGASATYTPNFTITYSVTGKAPNGCIDIDTLSVFVTTCTGVFQNGAKEIKYSVFPNPAKDKLTIYLGVSETSEFMFELLDISGKIVTQQSGIFAVGKSEQQINIGHLEKGVYFLKIIPKEGRPQQIKILKE